MIFYQELDVFGAAAVVPVRKKDEILTKRAGFIVFPGIFKKKSETYYLGLPKALLFYARVLIGRTDGA